jgi:exonuclease VII large subunit
MDSKEMMNGIENPLTLYSLNNLVREAVSVALPSRYWVTGELSEVREATNGHCYIELIQREETAGVLVAKARGTIWARTYSLLRPYFLEQTGQPFAQGLKVLLQVSVNFHELYGYTLDVNDIEPAYTIGDMARKRQLVIKQLTDEGVINLNKELTFPLLPQRVAVISSSTAAGYGDFCDQLHNNAYGFAFYKRELKGKKLIAVTAIVSLFVAGIVKLFGTTLCLAVMYGSPYWPMLISRIPNCIFLFVVQMITIPLIYMYVYVPVSRRILQ